MIEHYSHIRMEAKRTAMDAIVERGVNQNVNQRPADNSNPIAKSLNWMVGLGGLEPPTSPLSGMRPSLYVRHQQLIRGSFDKNHRLPGKSTTIMMADHGSAVTVFETVAHWFQSAALIR